MENNVLLVMWSIEPFRERRTLGGQHNRKVSGDQVRLGENPSKSSMQETPESTNPVLQPASTLQGAEIQRDFEYISRFHDERCLSFVDSPLPHVLSFLRATPCWFQPGASTV
jgi:hypothetical protein